MCCTVPFLPYLCVIKVSEAISKLKNKNSTIETIKKSKP